MAGGLGQNHPPVFPDSYHDLIAPVINAISNLGGTGTRSQIVSQIIAEVGFPPFTDLNYWNGHEPALQEPLRRRKVLFEERTGAALQSLQNDGVVVLQGNIWHLQP